MITKPFALGDSHVLHLVEVANQTLINGKSCSLEIILSFGRACQTQFGSGFGFRALKEDVGLRLVAVLVA